MSQEHKISTDCKISDGTITCKRLTREESRILLPNVHTLDQYLDRAAVKTFQDRHYVAAYSQANANNMQWTLASNVYQP